MNKQHYADINAHVVNKWVEEGWEWGQPITHEEYIAAQKGEWGVVLTPQIVVPKEWFAPYLINGRLDGVKILGLASGGGQQMPVFSALGASCTVLDYADAQLQSERDVAQREGYTIDVVKADMSRALPLADESFDMIFHPISNCYVQDVYHVWNECYRVLKPGGILLAGMDNGFNYLFDFAESEPLVVQNKLPYNPLNNPTLMQAGLAANDGVQFSHSLEEQIGGQLKAGFALTHLREDRDKEGIVCQYAPQYMLTRAVKQ